MPAPGDKSADQILELAEAEAFSKPEQDLSRVSNFCPRALAKVLEDEVVKSVHMSPAVIQKACK